MARFIKTISADGSSAGGGSGVSLAEVCTAVCNVICANATCCGGIVATQDLSLIHI